MKGSKISKLFKLLAINTIVMISVLTVLDFVFIQYYSLKSSHNAANLNRRPQLEEYKKYDWAKDYWQEHSQFRNNYKSFIGWKGTSFEGKSINVDSLGIRRTPNNSNSDSATKIAFLGGSTMWGFGVNDENTIPSQFAKLTDSLYVINMGQLGYTAYQSYILLQLEVSRGNVPDMVVSYDGANDTPTEKNPYAHLWEARMQERLKGMDFDSKAKEMIWMPGLRMFAYQMRSKLKSENKAFPERQKVSVSNEDNQQAAKELLQAWQLMKSLCEANGIPFYCILQPQMHVGKPNLNYLEGTPFKTFWEGYDDYVQYYDDVIELMDSEEFIDLKRHFIDLRFALDGLPSMYMDVCHLMPKGNQAIAQAIANEIL
jgi:lysophospholipase L1-like esterase